MRASIFAISCCRCNTKAGVWTVARSGGDGIVGGVTCGLAVEAGAGRLATWANESYVGCDWAGT
jgi:hypothetical protein